VAEHVEHGIARSDVEAVEGGGERGGTPRPREEAPDAGIELRRHLPRESHRPLAEAADVIRGHARLPDEDRLVKRGALVDPHLQPIPLVAWDPDVR
jgi:hypothetical protein